MAINGQQNIRIGLPNESVGSDSIRDAFTKVNTNFTNLFNNANPNVVAGNGITVDTNAGNVRISSNLVAGNGIALANANGAIVITNTGGGGNGGGGNVSSVQVIGADSNARITSTGGPITSAGTISLDLANSNVTAGTYSNPTLTVDRFGRVTAASNNTVAGTVTSVGLSPGTGISISGSPITSAGIITVTNTGVTRLTAGPGITLTGNTGAIQVSLAGGGGGGVSYIDILSNTLNVSGGPITSAGNIFVELRPNTTITGTLTANGLVVNGPSNLTGNVSIAGNLSVNGNITYINVENLNVQDPIIQLQTGPNGTPPVANTGKDVGSALNYYDTQARVAFMGWDVSNNEFGLASQATIASDIVTFDTYGNLRVGNIIGNGQALTGINPSNINGQVANALVAGTVYTASQPNITSLGNLTSANVTGNLIVLGNTTSANFIGALANGNSNVRVVSANGNVIISVGGVTKGTYSANGLAINGNISASNANLGNLAVANFFQGDGGLLTNISAAAGSQILNGNSNVSVAANSNVTISVAGTSNVIVVTNTGANITGTANISGNANVGNIGASAGVFTANITAGNVYANTGTIGALTLKGEGGNISNITAGNITGQVANSLVAGTVYTNAQPNITSVGTLVSLGVNNTVTAVAFTANTGIFTGNGAGLTNLAGGNVTGQVANALVAGTVYTNAQPNITSVGTLSNLAVTGNVTSGNVYANTGTIGAANLTGTITTADQPNITSVGNLTSLNVTGNLLANTITSNTIVKCTPVLFSALPTAATAGAGSRAFITDGNLAMSGNFGSLVTGGGSNNIPVISDGSNWRIG